MAQKSSDNNNENEFELSVNQTEDQNNDNNNDNNNESLYALNFPSFLSTNCSVPTELFNTLSPISLSQITSQSTPFIAQNRNVLRREPMGGEEYVDNRNNVQHKTYLVETHDESEELKPQNRDNERPPLIGETDNCSVIIGSRNASIVTSVEPIGEVSVDERDALAAKVEQLLGRTRSKSVDEDFDVESLGLIRVIQEDDPNYRNDSNDGSIKTTTDAIIEAERSEPDGKGKPYQAIQQNAQISTDIKKLVHYSSSESDGEEEDSVKEIDNHWSSTSSQKSIQMKTSNLSETAVRNRSYSASGSTGIMVSGQQTSANTGFVISSFIREKIQSKQISQKDSAGTQTLRSFLAEQALQQKHEDSGSQNASTTGSSALDLQKSMTSTDGEPIRDSIKNFETNGQQLVREFGSQSTNQNNSQQNIYIPTGMKNDIKSSQNGSDISSGGPLDRILDVFKPSSETSAKSSSSSSDGQKENKLINKQLLRRNSNSSNSQQNSEQNLNQEIKLMPKYKTQSVIQMEQKPSTQSINTSNTRLSPKKSKQYNRNESTTAEMQTQHERQFKHLVERQKNYLKCLQRELVRLEKMEKLFAKLNTSAKNSHQSKPVRHLSETHLQRESTTSLSTNSTNDHISSKTTTNKSSLILSSNGTPIFSPLSSNFQIIDNYSCDTTSKSSNESSVHMCCHNNHRRNSHSLSHRHNSPKKKHILSNKTLPKHIQDIKSTKIMRKSHSSKGIQTSDSLLNLKSTLDINKPKEEFEDYFENKEKEPISWFIPINKSNKKSNSLEFHKNATQYSDSMGRQYSRHHIKQTSTPLSLQEAFNRNCNTIRIESEIRMNRINTIADMRKRTAEERIIETTQQYLKQQQNDKLIKTNCIQSAYKTTIKRFFTHQQMRAQTEKIYLNLPEVKAIKERKKREEKERNQRLMAQIYKYRLKDNALKGKVSWKITQSCLSY